MGAKWNEECLVYKVAIEKIPAVVCRDFGIGLWRWRAAPSFLAIVPGTDLVSARRKHRNQEF
jgi:hypothetical protein